jgi:hypothetical protein
MMVMGPYNQEAVDFRQDAYASVVARAGPARERRVRAAWI